MTGAVTATAPAVRRVAITRLSLTNLRNHPHLVLETGGRMVVLTGPNGAGKTNILEAISLLAPGRGLRRASAGEIARAEGDGSWAVAAELEGALGPVTLGTGIEVTPEGPARRVRIDGAPASGTGALADHLRIVWLTPALDGLFTGPAGDRRRFLDRLVLALQPDHGSRVSSFERALRNRNRILEESRDARWLDAVEREAAELGTAIAAARAETVTRLAALIAEGRDDASPFPWAAVSIEGTLEAATAGEPASAVEDRYRDLLRESRARDRAAGRTTEGPHTSDLRVVHGPKGAPAERSSTGEQKALLVGLVLAHARLVSRMEGATPIVLLDEIAAHLDPLRRGALFDALEAEGAQAWMTGADPAAFEALKGRAARFEISAGSALALLP